MWQSGSAIAVVITLDVSDTVLCHTCERQRCRRALCSGPKRELCMFYLLANYRSDDLNNGSTDSSVSVN